MDGANNCFFGTLKDFVSVLQMMVFVFNFMHSLQHCTFSTLKVEYGVQFQDIFM